MYKPPQKLGVAKDMLVSLSQRGVYNPTDDILTTAMSAKAAALAAARRNVSAAVLAWLKVGCYRETCFRMLCLLAAGTRLSHHVGGPLEK